MEAATKTAEAPEAAKTAETTTETKTAPETKGVKRIVNRVSKELKDAGFRGKKQWQEVVKSARDLVKRAKPEIKREKLGEAWRKEVREAMKTLRTRSEGWTHSKPFLNARDRGAQFLLKLATRVKDAAVKVETNLADTLKYHKGDVVSGGTFTCTGCSEELKLTESGTIPACPKCGKVDFKRKA
ncbi:hypothetical protein HY251_15500 [bacterium]|nr:hypothetical protein [bacterium]